MSKTVGQNLADVAKQIVTLALVTYFEAAKIDICGSPLVFIKCILFTVQCISDPYGVCGMRVMANSALCTKCENWTQGRCAKTKRAIARLAMHFVCSKCRGIMEGTVDSIEKLCDEVETVNGLCYLRDRLNSSGDCEAVVTARVRVG